MSNRTELVKLKRTLGRINALAPETAALSDAALQAKTGEFRARLQKGETPRALLPEAYAVIREASRRILGMYPYDVQVMGAIALFAGNIAEMKTGEGKTLVASMPLYLSALTGNSTILVTMNNYLAIRDGELFQKLFAFLGMRLAIGVTDNPKEQLTAAKKRNIYAADVVYTTHAALGFDYLMENLAASREEKFLRPFYYCIIDEADAVLLDSATTPLVISGAPKVQSNLYEIADYFVSALEKDVDFEAEDKNVWLTPAGVRKAEQFFYLDHLYDGTHSDVVRHICLALRAHASFTRDKDYIVQDGSISLIDALSGRILANTKLRAGQHQALEAKEHLKITMENRSMATVTYQSLFRMFPHLAGMTGSGIEDAAELESTYGLKVVRIPTRKKIRRVDLPDRYFPNIRAQILAAFQDTVQLHEKGQPVLIVTSSIAMSQVFSDMLLERGIPHSVLNAYNTAREAQIIREAGHRGAVTVATSIAGRGTDIRLGEGVAALGGLAVLGIGRMDSKRMEVQARGRSGRQGDPGMSQFYISLDDDIVLQYGKETLKALRGGSAELHSRKIKRQIQEAQAYREDQSRAARAATFQYGENILAQRRVVYETRDAIIRTEEFSEEDILALQKKVIDRFLDSFQDLPDQSQLTRFILDHITYDLGEFPDTYLLITRQKMRDYLLTLSRSCLHKKLDLIPGKKGQTAYLRTMIIRSIDRCWIEEVDYMQQLLLAINGRQYAQRNTRYEYRREAYASFQTMRRHIEEAICRNVLLGDLQPLPGGKMKIVFP